MCCDSIKMSRYKFTLAVFCVILCLVQTVNCDSGASSEATGFASLAFPLSKYNFARLEHDESGSEEGGGGGNADEASSESREGVFQEVDLSHVSPTSTPVSTISIPIYDPKKRRREKEAEEKRRMSIEAAKRFRETFAFLKGTDGGQRRFHVHLVRFGDGNFTGELDKERRRHGWGEMVWSGGGGRYVGKWKDGKQHGIGTHLSPDGGMYVGSWSQGDKEGNGTMVYPNGNKYVGSFMDGKKHGYGEVTTTSGMAFRGYFRQDSRHGQGAELNPTGERYVGQYLNDQRHGQGASYYPSSDGSNRPKYVGDWFNGLPHGRGTMYLPNGAAIGGQFLYGKLRSSPQLEQMMRQQQLRQKMRLLQMQQQLLLRQQLHHQLQQQQYQQMYEQQEKRRQNQFLELYEDPIDLPQFQTPMPYFNNLNNFNTNANNVVAEVKEIDNSEDIRKWERNNKKKYQSNSNNNNKPKKKFTPKKKYTSNRRKDSSSNGDPPSIMQTLTSMFETFVGADITGD